MTKPYFRTTHSAALLKWGAAALVGTAVCAATIWASPGHRKESHVPGLIRTAGFATDELVQPTDQPESELPPIQFAAGPFRMDWSEIFDWEHVITGTPLAKSEVEHVRRVIEAALKRYPPGLLISDEEGKTVVSSVLVFEELRLNGRRAGGTYVPPALVFIAAGISPSRSPARGEHITQVVHHEISSQLLFKYSRRFDEERFRAALPEGFVYEDEVEGADSADIHGDKVGVESLADLADGFLEGFASRNLEQDFNTYAEILMWRPELFRQFAPDSRVGRKARVVRDFYIAIDERFETMLAPAFE